MRKRFVARVHKAIADPVLQKALDNNAERRERGRREALDQLDDLQRSKARARALRAGIVDNLDQVLSDFERSLQRNGFIVHRAHDAAAARSIILGILQEHNAKLVVKSKSMVTEEIRLNEALERSGIQTVETDLGEYIVQLRGEKPAHIITPAIHLMREQVAETFHQKLGMPFTTDVSTMNATARQNLRWNFLNADAGISGVNFGIAETGTLCLVTNEGNGRMVTTLPRLHIAVMGLERLITRHNDLDAMLDLLPRSATGQKLTSYVSLINHPRQDEDLDGPSERHVVIVDNGRKSLRDSDFREALLCIRCGACLNACPVYREIGGHSYESVYPGPIGSVISPLLFGLDQYGHLAKASTLCGACTDACPVGIDFPPLLLRARDMYTRQVPQPLLYSGLIKIFRAAVSSLGLYRTAIGLASIASRLLPKKQGWIRWLPRPLGAWTDSRDFPPFASTPFRERWKDRQHAAINHPDMPIRNADDAPGQAEGSAAISEIDLFKTSLEAVDGEFAACSRSDVAAKILGKLNELDNSNLIINDGLTKPYPDLAEKLSNAGIEVLQAPEVHVSSGDRFALYESAQVGLTRSVAGLADTGTVVIIQDPDAASATSLLPPTHFVLLDLNHVYPSLREWLARTEANAFMKPQSIILVTGPSRTADIEMTLTIGVHGPARVVVFGIRG